MALRWFLLVVCISCCVIGSLCTSPELENLVRHFDTSLPLGAIFGHKPCLGKSCGPLSEAPEDSEPQNPDIASPDGLVEHCLMLHSSTLHDASIIGLRHPDVDVLVRLKVIKDLVSYASYFSSLTTENCDPNMKLLDFIILAAEELKQDYANECGKTCNYIMSTDEKPGRSPKDKDGVQSTTPKSDDGPICASPYVSTEAGTKIPCPKNEPNEEIMAEDSGHEHRSPPFVGSMRGIPGVHYPNYKDVPVTSFSCADKKYIPGFYADLDAGCQVFHVCYEHRRESFLCPVGTIFNQPILACDYWYSANCSLAQEYYDVNAETEGTSEEETDDAIDDLIDIIMKHKKKTDSEKHKSQTEVDIKQFLPVKATITEFTKPSAKDKTVFTVKPDVLKVDEVASQIFNKLVSTVTNVVSKTPDVVDKIPEPSEVEMKPIPLGKVPVEAKLAKAKLAATVPVAKVAAKYKLTGAKAALPITAKAKLSAIPAAKVAAAKIAVPVAAKAKLAAAVPVKAAVLVKGKAKLAAVPKVALKAKMISSALPLAKAKIVAPALKGKALKSASVPVAKVKLAKAAAISPLTKKALALGYMKLLKAKKVALAG